MHAVCRLVRAPHRILLRIYSTPRVVVRASSRSGRYDCVRPRPMCAHSRSDPVTRARLVSKNSLFHVRVI
jgi:hypothetical protein